MNNEVFYTVISGTLVFVFGQIIQKFILEPILNRKKIIGKIHVYCKYYINVFVSSPPNSTQTKKKEKIHKIFRKLSCDFASANRQMPLYFILNKYLNNITSDLIYLSNTIFDPKMDLKENYKVFEKIYKYLKIKDD
jgi:hypothetical protein